MLLTIGEIIQRFRTHGRCIKFSPKTIVYMAKKLGFGLKRIGGKIGYDQSLITAITQRLDDAIAYENGLKKKTPQKALKQTREGDYYTYNGERDNKDYEWEVNEGVKRISITESQLKRLEERGII